MGDGSPRRPGDTRRPAGVGRVMGDEWLGPRAAPSWAEGAPGLAGGVGLGRGRWWQQRLSGVGVAWGADAAAD
jgi:hypothetical protein